MAGQALVILEPVCTQENPYFNQEDLLDSLAHYHLQLSPNNPAILIRVIVIIQKLSPTIPISQPPTQTTTISQFEPHKRPLSRSVILVLDYSDSRWK